MKEKYNYYIDFLKFIFSFIIVIYHSWIFSDVFGEGDFNYGYLAVDFYFINKLNYNQYKVVVYR